MDLHYISFSFGLNEIAHVGHLPTQNPHPVHFDISMVGINIALKSIASSKHGSLQEKHITPSQLRQVDWSMITSASMFLLSSTFSTPYSHAKAHSSQKVQPLPVKCRYGVLSSAIFMISSSQTVAHFPSHLLHSL